MRRHVRIDLAYDGTAFAGWQFQRGQRTVQDELESRLGELAGRRRVRVRGAGRTDSGVHARAQVADCEIDCCLDDAELTRALARMLPSDVRPIRVRTVAPDFDSQRHAIHKVYRYRLEILYLKRKVNEV